MSIDVWKNIALLRVALLLVCISMYTVTDQLKILYQQLFQQHEKQRQFTILTNRIVLVYGINLFLISFSTNNALCD